MRVLWCGSVLVVIFGDIDINYPPFDEVILLVTQSLIFENAHFAFFIPFYAGTLLGVPVDKQFGSDQAHIGTWSIERAKLSAARSIFLQKVFAKFWAIL